MTFRLVHHFTAYRLCITKEEEEEDHLLGRGAVVDDGGGIVWMMPAQLWMMPSSVALRL
jgi:hypothetical protein